MDYHMNTRELLEIPEDAFVVGMVGRLAEQKAPDVFVKAAKRIKEIIPKAFFYHKSYILMLIFSQPPKYK